MEKHPQQPRPLTHPSLSFSGVIRIRIFGILTNGNLNHRRQMLDAMECNAKGYEDFIAKVISSENVEGKGSIIYKKGTRNKSSLLP